MGDKLLLRDCKCPICMCILIEPVRMPCNHELCMPCFKKNVEEAHFTCPICRQRISSWARKQARTNQLVDLKRWKQIREAFPVLCQKRLNGEDDESEYDAESPVKRNILVAQPGEIRKDFEEEITKFQRIREEEEKQAREKSEELIERLQQEELLRYEEDRKREEAQREEDEELAKNIAAELDQDGSWKRKQEEQAARDAELARKLQLSDESPPSTVVSLLSPSTSSQKGATSSMKCNRLEHLFEKMESRRLSSGESSRDSSQETNLVHAFGAFSPTAATSSRLPSMDAVAARVHRAKSTESEDSIANEVSHFKPIKKSPRTARRRLMDGSCESPPIIHSTPRNLNRLNRNRRNDKTPSVSVRLVDMLSKKLEVPPTSPEAELRVSREVQASPEKASVTVNKKQLCQSERAGTSRVGTSTKEVFSSSRVGNSLKENGNHFSKESEVPQKWSGFSRKLKEVEFQHPHAPSIAGCKYGTALSKGDHNPGCSRSSSAELKNLRKRSKSDVKLKDQNENYLSEDTEDCSRPKKCRNRGETLFVALGKENGPKQGDKTASTSCSNGVHEGSTGGFPNRKGKEKLLAQPRHSNGAKTIEKYMQLLTAEQRKLKQEEMDRKVALELQKQFEQEAVEVVRTRGSEDAYPLRASKKQGYQELSPGHEA